MENNLNGLTEEAANDLLAFQARVRANNAAERRKPRGALQRVEEGEFVLCSWAEETTSLGVELWLRENSLLPIPEQDLETLRDRGYPKDNQALVALGNKVRHEVHVLHRRDGTIRIDKAERVSGSDDDLWYPGADWVPGVIFPARRG